MRRLSLESLNDSILHSLQGGRGNALVQCSPMCLRGIFSNSRVNPRDAGELSQNFWKLAVALPGLAPQACLSLYSQQTDALLSSCTSSPTVRQVSPPEMPSFAILPIEIVLVWVLCHLPRVS